MQQAIPDSDPADDDNLPTAPAQRSQQLAAIDPRTQALSAIMRPAEAAADDDGLDLLNYWRVIVRRKWTVLSVLVIVLLTGIMMTILTTPIFRATATMQIERQAAGAIVVPGVESSERSFNPYDMEFYETQFQLLRSRSMAEKVAAGLDPEDPVLALMSEPSPVAKLMGLIRGSAAPDTDPDTDVDPVEQKREQLVSLVRGGLSVEPVPKSRLVRIHFDSPDAAWSAKVANAVSMGFVESNMQRRIDNSAFAREFLGDNLEQVKLKLQDSEKALTDFAQAEKIVDMGERSSLRTAELESLTTALTGAMQERINAEAQLIQADGVNAYSHPLLVQNEGIQALRTTRAKLDAEYQEKLLRFKPNYPLMLQIKRQIGELDKQLEAEVQLIKSSVSAAYKAARDKEAKLKAEVDRLTSDMLSAQGRLSSMTLLEREVETNRQLYDALLQRYKGAGISANLNANNISIVDPALQPKRPFKPRFFLNFLMSLIVGLMFGVLLAFLFEYLDDTLKRPDEIEKHLGIGVLGTIPKLERGTTEEATMDPRSAFSEAYRSVRTSLQFSTEAGVPKVLLVTSSTAGEGKTTTALALARNFAELGRRVLLIDADLRNPSLHRILGSDNAVGLSNFLAGGIKPAAAIKPTKTLRLTFISSGPLPPNPAELLAGPKMLSLLSLAGGKFDQVIIDGPPIMGLADSPILSNLSSGTLLVIEGGSTRIATAKEALKRLLGARAHVVGALITKFDASTAGYGYGGDYGYHYAYGAEASAPRLTKA